MELCFFPLELAEKGTESGDTGDILKEKKIP